MRLLALLAAIVLIAPSLARGQSEPIRRPATPAASEQPAEKPPLATNRRSFFIPVTVDRPTAEHTPKEVHLLVSTDQGKTWSTSARQGADSKGFQFQATRDGEYWFASRTLDAQGKAKPAGDPEAELRIIIDTTLPKIELDAAITVSGELKAIWKITDASATPEGIKLEYQSGDTYAMPAWQSVTLDPALQQANSGMLLGSATWSPTGTQRVIDVRMVVQDRAGNAGTSERRVILPRRSDVPVSKLPEYPARQSQSSISNQQSAISNAPGTSSDPFTARQFSAGGKFESSKPTAPAAESKSSGTPWPADNKLPSSPPPSPNDKLADKPTALPTEPFARLPAATSPPVSDRVVAKPSSTGGESAYIWRPGAEQPEAGSDDDKPAPLQSVPEVDADPAPSHPSVDSGSGIDKPQLSPSKSFSLDYDVDSVGPAGMRAAELWVTIDGGQTWEKWGEDEDKRSPFDIQVESERTFGFRMVIVGNNGLATPSPQPGDPADIWVAIDSTKPSARLLQAAYGQGEHAGQLDIRWEADDEHLGQRPVTLAFSETPDGPYTTLAAGLPNSGQYFWTIDPRTPRKLYLRLEVRDDAGNVGVDQTSEPVGLEGLSPKGRIRAVLPSGAAPATQGVFRSPLFR